MRRPPADFKTPPYVTAQPVITHRKLDFLPLSETGPPMPFPASSPPSPASGSLPPSTAASSSAPVSAARPTAAEPARPALRFLVLATDGLWDQLSSRDAVALVAGHLAGLRAPAVSRAELAARAPTRLGTPGVEGKNKGGANANASERDGHAWAFVDADPAAHLVRNAFGGGDTARLRQLLSIPAPLSRRYRDDVTVTVVWWEDGRAEQARVERLNVPGGSAVDGEGAAEAKARAKL
ncbi:hypothetical protein DFH11DRAFT_1723513 [Phellopilus nigrolimitatus]|nr:hypothetical protein DFH11DRAFT_1723513 [Phellopilus nigrolimitatus]